MYVTFNLIAMFRILTYFMAATVYAIAEQGECMSTMQPWPTHDPITAADIIKGSFRP